MPLHRHRSRSRLPLILPLVPVLALARTIALGFPSTPRAQASSNGSMVVSPLTGGAGTHVTIDTHIFADTTASYELRYTTTSPDQGGCLTSHPLPVDGVNPFQAGGSAPGMVEFDWPASLGSDRYFFCAYSTSVGTPVPGVTPSPTIAPPFQTGEMARSIYAFTVLRDATPQIVFSAPADGVPLGSIMGVQINDWQSSDHQAPAHVWLVISDGYTWYDLQLRVLAQPDATGTTTLKVTLPTLLAPYNFTSPANFVLVACSPGICQASALFQVNPIPGSAATPVFTAAPLFTPVVSSPPDTSVGAASTGPSPLVLALSGLMFLIALGLVAVVIVLAVRSRADARRQAMAHMGLDVEPLDPVAPRATSRPRGRRGYSQWDDRAGDHSWQLPTRPR